MTISRINVNNTEYEIKDEYARNNLGASEEKVNEIVSEYVTEHREEFKGDDGKTPQRGVDYWTNSDKAEIVSECKSYIDSEILGGAS